MADTSSIKAVVCVPTFKRARELALTLASLKDQTAPFAFAVVVVDNDAAQADGAAVAEAWFSSGRLIGQTVVEEKQGNCHAINTGFDVARAAYPQTEFFLMMDDDEVAEPQWVEQLVRCAELSEADLVGGPVLRRFEGEAPDSYRLHPVFTSLEGANGPVPVIYGSGNFLVRRRVFEGLDSPHFDIRFNHMGGGDMEFFRRCRLHGFSFYWDAEAIVHEMVPRSRMQDRWILRRSLHIGAINYTADRKHAPGLGGLVKLQAKNLGSLMLGIIRSIRALVVTRQPLIASYPALVSAGRLLASFGFTPKPYKATKG